MLSVLSNMASAQGKKKEADKKPAAANTKDGASSSSSSSSASVPPSAPDSPASGAPEGADEAPVLVGTGMEQLWSKRDVLKCANDSSMANLAIHGVSRFALSRGLTEGAWLVGASRLLDRVPVDDDEDAPSRRVTYCFAEPLSEAHPALRAVHEGTIAMLEDCSPSVLSMFNSDMAVFQRGSRFGEPLPPEEAPSSEVATTVLAALQPVDDRARTNSLEDMVRAAERDVGMRRRLFAKLRRYTAFLCCSLARHGFLSQACVEEGDVDMEAHAAFTLCSSTPMVTRVFRYMDQRQPAAAWAWMCVCVLYNAGFMDESTAGPHPSKWGECGGEHPPAVWEWLESLRNGALAQEAARAVRSKANDLFRGYASAPVLGALARLADWWQGRPESDIDPLPASFLEAVTAAANHANEDDDEEEEEEGEEAAGEEEEEEEAGTEPEGDQATLSLDGDDEEPPASPGDKRARSPAREEPEGAEASPSAAKKAKPEDATQGA